MIKSWPGGFNGQIFVPRTMTPKLISGSPWLCVIRSLNWSVRSLLRLTSANDESVAKLSE